MPQEDRGQYRRPLVGAAENGYISMVKLLLKIGVNANITDIGYPTALSCAAENGYDAMRSTERIAPADGSSNSEWMALEALWYMNVEFEPCWCIYDFFI